MDTYSISTALIISRDVNNFFWLFDPPPKTEDSKIYFPLLVQQKHCGSHDHTNNDVGELDDYVDFVDGFVDQVDDIVDQKDDIVDHMDDE